MSFFSVDLREVKEVRPGTNSRDFEKLEDLRKLEPSLCYVLLYGSQFRLKTLSVAGIINDFFSFFLN